MHNKKRLEAKFKYSVLWSYKKEVQAMDRDIKFFNRKHRFIVPFLILLMFSIAHAHVEDDTYKEEVNIGKYIKTNSLNYLLIASIIVLILILFSIFYKEKTEKMKIFLFLGIAIPTILVTAYLAGSTIYLNLISQTKGPIHWHADFEIWNCNKKVDLMKPEGLSNKIGSAVLHEHDDNRIHVEGVVVDEQEVYLHNFFKVIGATLSESMLSVPVDDGILTMKNGDLCNGQQGKLQVFLYKVKNPNDAKEWVFEQEKLETFGDYVLSPYSNVPPGDCLVIELGPEKDRTDKICETYKSAINRGDLSGG